MVEINVIDCGQGMSKEGIDSLGTPFYSLKSEELARDNDLLYYANSDRHCS